MGSMALLDAMRYQFGPPLMVALVTAGVQLLAVVGGGGLTNSWSVVGSVQAWTLVSALCLWALLSLWIPGKVFVGPHPPHGGAAPTYRANGFQFFVVSLLLCILGLFLQPTFALQVYTIFPEILAACNVTALSFCTYLLIIGKWWPQTKEELTARPLVYEFYRGMEIHPRILGVDVKQLTNCRFGLLAWQLLVVIFFVAGGIKNGWSVAHFVCVALQTIYLAKFYWWETGYFNTLDITLDRAGYYICWGCIVFVPGFYTFTSYYLVAHPPVISDSGAVLCFILGILAIGLNYRIDWEKEYFRHNNGKCFIWNRPAKFIKATYLTYDKKQKTSYLLTSGFWGISRHLNYVFELMLTLSWSLPGLGLGFGPFLYFIFLTILLIHRIFRDEEKCKAKYGKYWVQYCEAVPYRLIPGIF
uniref:7-dehydrocholesterol reductase n=1 Tax=Hirondellea gigas TaxID=1518452 RepID=A0A2P2HXE9_9CRUS